VQNKPKRDEALNAMLEHAGKEFVPGQDNPLWRIDLTRFQRSYTILGEVGTADSRNVSTCRPAAQGRAVAAAWSILGGGGVQAGRQTYAGGQAGRMHKD
jgi:hypothetical protein